MSVGGRPRRRRAEGGLARFGGELHPALLAAVERWSDDPALAALRATLDGHHNLKSFLDTLAEAVVARHLAQRGCTLRFEVPTPGGKACDFEVTRGEAKFYLHVKRLDTDVPVRNRLTISSRLRSLERIERPYVVKVRWHEGIRDEETQRLVREATAFILHARVGDELVVRGNDGAEIGGVLVVAPWEGTHVSLAIGLPSGFNDETLRIRRLLRRAHRQFMPRAENVILVCSSHAEDVKDFESALLGSHVERWDAFPPQGRRVAHGRASDGFWSGSRFPESRAAGWFRLAPDADGIEVTLRVREGAVVDEAVRASLGGAA